MANSKTNAMRILDAKNILYDTSTYDKKDGKIDGISVAQKIGKEPEKVYKTLVTEGTTGEIYVFVIPVKEELGLKKAARITGEKKIEMIPVKNIQRLTGYIRGGCSPIGMKKDYKTFIDISAQTIKEIIISAGKIGIQIELNINDLLYIVNGELQDIIKR